MDWYLLTDFEQGRACWEFTCTKTTAMLSEQKINIQVWSIEIIFWISLWGYHFKELAKYIKNTVQKNTLSSLYGDIEKVFIPT